MGATKKIYGISSLLVFRQNLFEKNVQITQRKNYFFRKTWQFCKISFEKIVFWRNFMTHYALTSESINSIPTKF